MLEDGIIEKNDKNSFVIHFIDDIVGRMPGEKWFKEIDQFDTKDNSSCEVHLQPNNSSKTIFTKLIIEYENPTDDLELIKTHKNDFINFYNQILYVKRKSKN